MKKLLFAVLLFSVAGFAQTPQCRDYPITATGRTLLDLPSGPGMEQFGSAGFTYRTSGIASLSFTVEAGPNLATVSIPGTKISAQTTLSTGSPPTIVDAGVASGSYRHWYANVATLNAGTLTLTGCFSPGNVSRAVVGPSGLSAGQAVGTDSSKRLVSIPIRYADQFAGADACAKIHAAGLNLINGGTGGTVDARGLAGSQSCASNMFAGWGNSSIVVLLGATTLAMTAQQVIGGPGISVIGLGPAQTGINCTYNGVCFSIHESTFNSTADAGQISDFSVNGSSGASAVGIEMGDIIGMRIKNVEIAGFTGTNSMGLHWINSASGNGWTERTDIEGLWLYNNTVGWHIEPGTATATAFAYNFIHSVYFNVEANQTGFLADGAASMTNCKMHMIFNIDVASGIGFSAQGTASLTNSNYDIRLDSGGLAASGISVAAGASVTGWPFQWYTGAGVTTSITGTFYAQQLLGNVGLGTAPSVKLDVNGTTKAVAYATATNCASAGGTCAAAPAGSVSIAAAGTTVTVATTAVTANSRIFIQEDATLGTALSVTCNTTTGRVYTVTTRTAATSFVITASAAPAANPACLNFFIVN